MGLYDGYSLQHVCPHTLTHSIQIRTKQEENVRRSHRGGIILHQTAAGKQNPQKKHREWRVWQLQASQTGRTWVTWPAVDHEHLEGRKTQTQQTTASRSTAFTHTHTHTHTRRECEKERQRDWQTDRQTDSFSQFVGHRNKTIKRRGKIVFIWSWQFVSCRQDKHDERTEGAKVNRCCSCEDDVKQEERLITEQWAEKTTNCFLQGQEWKSDSVTMRHLEAFDSTSSCWALERTVSAQPFSFFCAALPLVSWTLWSNSVLSWDAVTETCRETDS